MLPCGKPSVIQVMADVRSIARSKVPLNAVPHVPVSFASPEAHPVDPVDLADAAMLAFYVVLRAAVREALAAVLRPRRPQGGRGGRGFAADRRAALARSAGADVRQLAGDRPRRRFSWCCAAFVATGDAERDAAAQRIAKAAGVPVNVADRPALCDFILPAIVDRDGVVVAISTGGARRPWPASCAAASRRLCRNGSAPWPGWPRPSAPRRMP